MKQEVKIDQADYTIFILVRDTSGNAKTGLAFGDIDLAYARVETDNDVTTTDVAPADLVSPALTDPHLDWGFLEVAAADHPGLYRLDIADEVFATGAWSAVVTLTGTGLEPSHCEFVMVPASPYAGVQLQPTHAAVTFATLSVTGQLDAGSVLIDAGMDVVGALSANSLLIDTTTTLTGNVSCAAAFDVVGALTAGSVSIDAGFDVVGALSANSLLIDTTATVTGNALVTGTMTHTGAVTLTNGINAGAISGTLAADIITATSLKADAVTKIIDNFETQSQADPTGFHVNVKEVNGTPQTARDIGANVLLSPGTGAGQLDITSGVVKSNLTQILGTVLTETAGYIAAAFKKLFNVGTPLLVSSDVMRGTDGANTTVPDAAGVAPTAVEIRQEMDSNSADLNTIIAYVDELESRLSAVRAGYLDNLSGGAIALASGVKLSAQGKLDVNAEADAALSDYGANTTVPDAAGTAAALHGTTDTLIADVPTVAEFEARTLPSADYVVVGDTIAGVTTCSTNADMRGTDNAALASVCTEGRLAELDAANLPTDVAAIPTAAMRGTDNAALASVCTEGRLAELDAANLITDVANVKTDTAAIKVKTDNLPSGIAKNVALPSLDIFMVLSSDHVSAATGKTVTGQIRKDGGAFADITNAITEVSGGWYTIADGLTQSEMNADKIVLKFTATDCDQRGIEIFPT